MPRRGAGVQPRCTSPFVILAGQSGAPLQVAASQFVADDGRRVGKLMAEDGHRRTENAQFLLSELECEVNQAVRVLLLLSPVDQAKVNPRAHLADLVANPLRHDGAVLVVEDNA